MKTDVCNQIVPLSQAHDIGDFESRCRSLGIPLLKLDGNDRICQREHLSTIEKPYAKNRYSMAEYKLAEKGLPIWKEQLRSAIDEAKEHSRNLVDLKSYLKENFNIEMKI